MLKPTFRLTILGACGTLGLLLLLNGAHFGVVQGQAVQQRQALRTTSAASADTRKTIHVVRDPARVIKDPYSGFSAVAVDAAHNEIILQDENKGQIMVYDRLENTPPRAALSEPKRIIGGKNPKVAMNCGVY